MNKRGIIILSTLFGLFALSFGVLGVRALTLGPDRPQPTQTELAARTTAANQLEKQIAAARAEAPPALPALPGRVDAVTGGGAARTAMPAPAQAQAPAYYEDDDEYEQGEKYEETERYEEEGDHDDD